MASKEDDNPHGSKKMPETFLTPKAPAGTNTRRIRSIPLLLSLNLLISNSLRISPIRSYLNYLLKNQSSKQVHHLTLAPPTPLLSPKTNPNALSHPMIVLANPFPRHAPFLKF